MDEKLTEEETAGVKAIVALQAVVGLEESEEKALTGWRNMTEWQRKQTMAAHAVVCGKGKKGDA